MVFHLTKPYNAFLYTLAVFGIVPEHCYDAKTYGEQPVGSGRYILKQWDRGQQVILEANPDYYGETPKMKTVIVLFMEEDAALAAVKAGQADIAYTSAVYSEEQVEGYGFLACKSVDSRGISLPTRPSGNPVTVEGDMVYAGGNGVTSDLAIRQAMSYPASGNHATVWLRQRDFWRISSDRAGVFLSGARAGGGGCGVRHRCGAAAFHHGCQHLICILRESDRQRTVWRGRSTDKEGRL